MFNTKRSSLNATRETRLEPSVGSVKQNCAWCMGGCGEERQTVFVMWKNVSGEAFTAAADKMRKEPKRSKRVRLTLSRAWEPLLSVEPLRLMPEWFYSVVFFFSLHVAYTEIGGKTYGGVHSAFFQYMHLILRLGKKQPHNGTTRKYQRGKCCCRKNEKHN